MFLDVTVWWQSGSVICSADRRGHIPHPGQMVPTINSPLQNGAYCHISLVYNVSNIFNFSKSSTFSRLSNVSKNIPWFRRLKTYVLIIDTLENISIGSHLYCKHINYLCNFFYFYIYTFYHIFNWGHFLAYFAIQFILTDIKKCMFLGLFLSIDLDHKSSYSSRNTRTIYYYLKPVQI